MVEHHRERGMICTGTSTLNQIHDLSLIRHISTSATPGQDDRHECPYLGYLGLGYAFLGGWVQLISR
jgi:hypothetical protein